MLAKNVIDLVMNGLNMFFQILPESSFEVTSFTSKILIPVMNNFYVILEFPTQTCVVALAAHFIPNLVMNHFYMSLQGILPRGFVLTFVTTVIFYLVMNAFDMILQSILA